LWWVSGFLLFLSKVTVATRNDAEETRGDGGFVEKKTLGAIERSSNLRLAPPGLETANPSGNQVKLGNSDGWPGARSNKGNG